MADYREISRRLHAIHEAPDEEQTLDRTLAFALSALGCEMAGVMLTSSGNLQSAGVTSPTVRLLDQLQMELGEGPCLSAIREHDNFRIDDTSIDPRWPKWGPEAARIGIRSVLSTRMSGLERPVVGSVNLYARRIEAFGPDEVEIAGVVTRHATTAFLKARQSSATDRALQTRTTIGQAEGILMERFAIDADAAFSVLRRYSQDLNVPVRDIARQLVEGRRLPPVAEPSSD